MDHINIDERQIDRQLDRLLADVPGPDDRATMNRRHLAMARRLQAIGLRTLLAKRRAKSKGVRHGKFE